MRIEFQRDTKIILAGRAGYRCSFPTCRIVTIGPGIKADDVSITGTASHIFSAAPGGPRGQGGLSSDQLIAVTNGIWLCHTHARLVDANEGDAFPASFLISMRNLHEAWVAREQGDFRAPFGWIQEIHISLSDLFRPNSTIRFGKVTVVFGLNNSGKSALFDWMAGASNPGALWRWVRQGSVQYRITYYDPYEHHLTVTTGEHFARYELDGRSVPHNPIPFRVVTVHEPGRGFDELSDLKQVAVLLGIDAAVVRNLLESVADNPTFTLAAIDEAEVVRLNVRGAVADLSWRQLSHGEQTLVVLEVAFALATIEAEFHPTILLLDWGVAHLDNKALSYLTERLSAASNSFQTVIMTLPRATLEWKGWQIARLRGTRPAVAIEQELVVG